MKRHAQAAHGVTRDAPEWQLRTTATYVRFTSETIVSQAAIAKLQ